MNPPRHQALPSHPLELSGETMRKMVDRAMERIVAHIESLPEQPMHATRGGKKIARWLREPMPEQGMAFERILKRLFGKVIPTSLNTASPGYLAYVPGGGIFHAAVADLIADATNRYVGVWIAAPALVEIEANVIRWFGGMLGLPESSGGLLTTGGSMATLIAIVTARRERLPSDFLRGVIYTSAEAHHSVMKAAIFAGFPRENLRLIPTDERFRLIPSALEEAIVRDLEYGLTPFLVVANAGSTNTGAVDDLAALATLAARERLWLHVDAAYGGFFALTARGRAVLEGIERADSITLDPHKGLFLPYGTGALVVRDREALRRAHSGTASYMPPMQGEGEFMDFCEMSPELSRDVRGLRVWIPMKMHGAGVFRAALDEKLDLARHAAERIRSIPGIEIVSEPVLSLFSFRLKPEGMAEPALIDAFNRKLMARVNARQRVLLTGATVNGNFVIRICVMSFRTHLDRIEMALEDIESSLREMMRGESEPG